MPIEEEGAMTRDLGCTNTDKDQKEVYGDLKSE
jgi:hypothetical protein